MEQNATIQEVEGLTNGLGVVGSVSDKHLELLRPSARHVSVVKGLSTEVVDDAKGKYTLLRDAEAHQLGMFLLGFVFPLMWYYATILYFGNYYRKDPRERAGLAASAIAALICSIVVFITVAVVVF